MPAWLRSLIWVDSAKSYDAFLSYSWKCDSQVAPVIQSVLQRFLCPWYKVRAKTIFRDLSCLPAGSSLERELFDRLERSSHLIVLASPDAATSHGMEMEARHWFARKREGQVLIIVSQGGADNWETIRNHLIPTEVKNNLSTEPLWIPLFNRRDHILNSPNSHETRSQVVEDLKQVILCLYPGRDWGQLRGEERRQRRRAISWIAGSALVFLMLAVASVGFAFYAQVQKKEAIQAQGRAFTALKAETEAQERAVTALKEVIRRLELQVTSDDASQVSVALEQLISVHQHHASEVLALVPDERFTSNAFFLALVNNVDSAIRDGKNEHWAQELRRAFGQRISVARRIPRPGTESSEDSLNQRVLIKASHFRMGSSNAAGCISCRDELPLHEVSLSAYYMQKHLVTNREYARFDLKYRSHPASEPAVNLNWYDALTYAVWIGGDLPTEAQWEFAARGPEGQKYSWGNDDPARSDDPLVEIKHPNRPSAAGIWELSGILWQWCRDVYGPYPSGKQQDPAGPQEGYVRVLRGGSSHDRPEFCRAAYRFNYHPAVATGNAGFRVVWPTN